MPDCRNRQNETLHFFHRKLYDSQQTMGFIVEGYGDFMHISLLLMEQILELFLMILMGFIIVKAGRLPTTGEKLS